MLLTEVWKLEPFGGKSDKLHWISHNGRASGRGFQCRDGNITLKCVKKKKCDILFHEYKRLCQKVSKALN